VEKRITYVGLDEHKDTIAVALAEAGKRGEVREYGKIANTASALQSLVSKLARGGQRLLGQPADPPERWGLSAIGRAGHMSRDDHLD
jgi:hypothetical protein